MAGRHASSSAHRPHHFSEDILLDNANVIFPTRSSGENDMYVALPNADYMKVVGMTMT